MSIKRGEKITKKVIEELYNICLLIKYKKTKEWHVSLNPRKKKEIYKFLKLPPRIILD